MAALVVASTSANPYIAYLDTLQASFSLQHSTPGFRARIICLVALLSAALVLVILHVILGIIEARRKRTGAVWFFRLVPRPAGRVLVTNFRLVTDFLTTVNLSLYLSYVCDVWKVYHNGDSQVRTTRWRGIITFMVVLEGWTISWGILQAYLLTPEQYIQATRRPWLANSLFVGGTFTICGTLAALGGVDYVASRDLQRDYVTVQNGLEVLAAAWTGTTDILDLGDLVPQLAALNKALVWYRRCDLHELAFSATAALLITLTNIGSLLMVRVLQRHIASSRRQILQIADIGTDTEARDTELLPPHAHTSKLVRMGRDPSQPSRAVIRAMARESDGATRQHAKNFLALQQAQSDLIYISTTLIAIATTACGFLINAAIQQSRPAFASWPQLELSLLFFPWLYGIFILVAFACLNINRLSSLSEPSDDLFPPGATDLASTGVDASSLRGSTTLREFFSRRTEVELGGDEEGGGRGGIKEEKHVHRAAEDATRDAEG